MQASGAGFGICGAAVMRAADAMLRSLGGEEISLLLPLSPMAGDAAAQLGLADPGVEEVKITPAIARNLPTANHGPRRRVEFLVPASAITAALSQHDFGNAEEFMNATLGIVYEGEMFHIEGFTTENFGAAAYLYRVVGVE